MELELDLDYKSKKVAVSLISLFAICVHYLFGSFADPERITYIAPDNVKTEPRVIEENGCVAGRGTLIPDIWDMKTSEKAMDIVNDQKKIRGHGAETWFQKNGYGSYVFESGCSIIDVKVQFDEEYHDKHYDGTAHTMLGIIKEDHTEFMLSDPNVCWALNNNVYGLGAFTRDGYAFQSGHWAEVDDDGVQLYKSGDIVRIIVDLDEGRVKFKWNYDDSTDLYLHPVNISMEFKYRVAVAIYNEESVTFAN